MTDTALFDIDDPGAAPQKCDLCPAALTATVDGLRVKGWAAYDGVSFTGKTLNVRICPKCRAEGDRRDSARDRLDPLPQVPPRLPGPDW